MSAPSRSEAGSCPLSAPAISNMGELCKGTLLYCGLDFVFHVNSRLRKHLCKCTLDSKLK